MGNKPNYISSKNVTPGKGRVQISSNVGNAISAALNYQMAVAWEAAGSPRAMERFFDSLYDEVDQAFGAYADAKSLTNPKSLQHVYEWEGLGKDRLWKLKRSNQTDNGMHLSFTFLQSRRVAPVNPILRIPGPTGKVVKRSAVFKNKAAVIESGMPVTIRPKNARFLAIPVGGKIVFSDKPVVIRNPGGDESTLGFTKTFNSWMGTQASQVMRRGRTTKRLELAVLKAGNNVPMKIRRLGITGRISTAEVERLAREAVDKQL